MMTTKKHWQNSRNKLLGQEKKRVVQMMSLQISQHQDLRRKKAREARIKKKVIKKYNHKKAIIKPDKRYPKKILFWGFIKLSGIKFKTSKSILLSHKNARHQGEDVLQ